MESKSVLPKKLNFPFWEFLFQIAFLSPAPAFAYGIILLLEKILILTPILLRFLKEGNSDSIFTFVKNFNVNAGFI